MAGLVVFLSRLIFRREPSPAERMRPVTIGSPHREERAVIPALKGSSDFGLQVVGGSNYQRNLEAICGRRTDEGEDRIFDALLVPEDSNPQDPNAVRIEIFGKTVGYLRRDNAIEFRKSLMRQLGRVQTATCSAIIRGGWDRSNGDRGHYEVLLDV